MNNPIISFCIPTYNRAEVLRKSLESYVNNAFFDEHFEIIISDNASTDNTNEVGEYYASKYDNIKYFKNECNIRDANFPLSMDRASGKYLKLMKDNLIILDDGLKYLKNSVLELLDSKIPVFFSNGALFNSFSKDGIYCDSFDSFIVHLSYYVTSIFIFGCWKEDWEAINDKLKYSKLQLSQDDWAYQILERRGNAYIKSGIFCESIEIGRRSGYNWFKVHVENYYAILQPYVDKGVVSKAALSIEKKTYLIGLRPFIALSFYKNYNPDWKFDMSGALKFIWRAFKGEKFFYLFVFNYPFWIISRTIHKFVEKIEKIKYEDINAVAVSMDERK